MNEKLAGDLFEKYYMKNGLWRERLQEVKEKGFDNASPIARLIYSCEIGEINQHASEDLKMISAALCVGYDLEQELKLRASTSIDLDKWSLCTNHGGYEIERGCLGCENDRYKAALQKIATDFFLDIREPRKIALDVLYPEAVTK